METSSTRPREEDTRMESKAADHAVVSESELSKSVKNLKATKAGREHSDSLEYDPQIADKLGTLCHVQANADTYADECPTSDHVMTHKTNLFRFFARVDSTRSKTLRKA